MMLTAMAALIRREWLRFFRQRSRVIGALITPLLFWILLGGGLESSFKNPQGDESYALFFYPGAILMSVLFTAIFSTISVIEDRNEGFLQGVLVAPFSSSALVLSKIISGALLGLGQGILLLLLAPFLGYSLAQFLPICFLLFLCGTALTGLGFLVAWLTNSVQGYHAFMNLLLFPMWLLSGAVFPVAGSHKVFQWIASINPLSYGLAALRSMLNGGVFYENSIFLAVAILVAFTLIGIGVAHWAVKKTF